MRKTAVAFLALVITFVWASTSYGKEKTYRIGAIFAVTGPAAWLGDPEKKTVEVLAKKINEEGGINGKKLDIVVLDTQGDPQTAVIKARELVTKDRVMAILGPSRTPTSAAVMKALQLDRVKNRFQVPLVSCAAGKILTQPVKPWVFTTPQTNALAAEKVLDYLSSTGVKKAALIYVSNGFGEDGYNNLKAFASQLGIEIVGAETYSGKDRDMTAQLTKLAAKSPDAIINWSVGPTSVIVTKNFKQLGLDKRGIKLVMNHGQGNLKYVELCGEAAEGVLLPAGRILVAQELSDKDLRKKVLVEFKKLYEDTYKEPVSTFAGHAYDALMLVVEALKKGNVSSGDGEALRKSLETKTSGFVGIDGVFHYTAQDHNGLTKSDLVMLKVERGAFKLIR
jgi:branched-chain amino acid transport system substrate-binding protein